MNDKDSLRDGLLRFVELRAKATQLQGESQLAMADATDAMAEVLDHHGLETVGDAFRELYAPEPVPDEIMALLHDEIEPREHALAH